MKKWILFCLYFSVCGSAGLIADDDGKKEIPWGPEKDGVKTRLVPLTNSPEVGKPMTFRLEMKNFSDAVVRYDSQAVGTNDTFSVKNPAGAEVPYVGGSYQTVGGARELAPGKEVVLVPSVDLAMDYLVTEPGIYRIQFRQQGPAFGKVNFPESNIVEIEIGKGTPGLARLVAGRLNAILPDKRWEVSINETGVYLACNRTGLKADVYYVTFLLEKEELEGDAADGYELIGSEGGTFFYVEEKPGGEAIEEIWTGHRKAIVDALEISER